MSVTSLPATGAPRQRLAGLDGVRGLAALFVVHRRARRILPAYWAARAFAALFEIPFQRRSSSSRAVLRQHPRAERASA